jgi:hypothetical protein
MCSSAGGAGQAGRVCGEWERKGQAVAAKWDGEQPLHERQLHRLRAWARLHNREATPGAVWRMDIRREGSCAARAAPRSNWMRSRYARSQLGTRVRSVPRRPQTKHWRASGLAPQRRPRWLIAAYSPGVSAAAWAALMGWPSRAAGSCAASDRSGALPPTTEGAQAASAAATSSGRAICRIAAERDASRFAGRTRERPRGGRNMQRHARPCALGSSPGFAPGRWNRRWCHRFA